MSEDGTADKGAGVGMFSDASPRDRVRIEIDAIDTYYYAASHRSVIRSICIENLDLPEEGDDVVLSVSVSSPLADPPLRPREFSLPAFPARDTKVLNGVRLQPNHRALALLTEQLPGEIVVTASVGGVRVGEAREPITFLAFNQWMFRPEYFDSLAAFVQPNSPALRPILTRARELLRERTGQDSTEGYQSLADDPGRVREMAAAVYDALREQGVGYTNPPASFEGYGQKVRTPEVVLDEGAATCLDSAVLYASCLLAFGVEAYIVLVNGHAFAAYNDHKQDADADVDTLRRILQQSVVMNPNDVALLQQVGLLNPVETTFFTLERETKTFADAERQDIGFLTTDADRILGMVNIVHAREHGVPPIPSQSMLSTVAAQDSEADTTDPLVAAIDTPFVDQLISAPSRRDLTSDPDDPSQHVPARVQAWLRSLLDLSFANPLLRLGGTSGTTRVHRFDLPAGVLGTLEDRLMSDGFVDLLPASHAPAALLRDPHDAVAIGGELRNAGRLYAPDLPQAEELFARLKKDFTAQNPEVAPAQIDTAARDLFDDALTSMLDREINGLRRRAREVETQTGANTLFLTIGTLSWRETVTSRGRAAENLGRAPLFLIPVRITGKGSTGFRITTGDTADVIPNYCLLEKLRQTHDITLDALERPASDDAGIDVNHLILKVREALSQANIRDAVVGEDAYLAVLNFSTFRLWKDMRDHWETFLESPVVKHLVEHPNESFDNVEPAVTLDAANLRCPIEVDQSQLEAVRWAVEGRSFVLEGPPGTGKSQTIANLLAASIAAGKKVLFVAEKQAALGVVKKRLDRAGLGSFCLDLHDKGSKPEQIRSQIRESLDFAALDRTTEWNEINAKWSSDAQVLTDYRDALHTHNAAGHSAWTARQESMGLDDGPALEVPLSFVSTADVGLPVAREILLNLPRLIGPGVPASGSAWTLADRGAFATIDTPTLASAIGSLATLRALLSEHPQVVEAIAAPADLHLVHRTLELWQLGQLPTGAEIAQLASPPWAAQRDHAFGLLDVFLTRQAPVLEVFSESVYSTDLGPLLAAGTESTTAGMLSRGKKTRAFQAQVAPFLRAPTELPAADLLALLHSAAAATPDLGTAYAAVSVIPGGSIRPGWSPFDPAIVGEMRARLAGLPDEARVFSTPASITTSRALAAGWLPDQRVVDTIASAAAWWQNLSTSLGVTDESLDRWMAGRSFMAAWAESEPAWQADAPRFLTLQRWCEVIDLIGPLREVGLGHIRSEILRGEVSGDSAYEQFRRGFIATVLQERLESGRIDLFDGRSHDRRIEDFVANDGARRQIIRDLIPAELVAARPVRGGRRIGKWGALEQELARKSRRLSIRRLVDEYSDILPDLTPCFLMSPDSVARFVPPGSITFDMVVFDEASQIEVPQAIGAIGRARSVVVVGDTRQMPPSRFGGSATGDPDAEPDPSDETLYEDLESILSEAVESNIPRLYLECHYRSRHEALIAFSNHHFYDDRLTTFPSPAGPEVTPIRWRRVDGLFERETKGDDLRTNGAEAQAIVDEIRQRVHNPLTSSESIAVVTLNVPQQARIIRMLEEAGDDRIKTLLEDEGEDGLIVRNLESVQGDERDVVMLSVAFSPPLVVNDDGKTTRGRLPLNFGPLNKKGGERRLNVAVTRARAEVVVFCSFDPEEMKLTESSSTGLTMLQTYLKNARDGIERSADLIARAPTPPDLHRAEIATALRERGLKVRENVGLSSFRIDLAVGRPEDDDWAVAVLLDGPGWAERATVYDRDALPPSVLNNAMGWRSTKRIWFPMWLTSSDEVLNDIEQAVVDACTPKPERGPTNPPVEASISHEEALVARQTDPSPPTSPASEVEPDPESPPPFASAHPTAQALAGGTAAVASAAPRDDWPAIGEQWMLDTITEPSVAARVRQAIHELLAEDSPIEATLLAKTVAGRFGYSQVRQKRVDEILAFVPAANLRTSEFGRFAWRDGHDPATWTGFRDVDAYGRARALDLVAPEELANAIVDLVRQGVEISAEEVVRHTAEAFGIRRISAGARDRIAKVVAWQVAEGHLVETNETLRLP